MLLPYDDTGAGAIVVLLHAGIADRTMWADVVPALAAAGYRAIAMDLPGLGEAPAAPQHAPHRAVLDALNIDRATLVGSSFGGAVSLRVAVTAPDRVSALVLVSTPAPGIEASAEPQAAWGAEDSALDRGDVEAAVAAVVEVWTLPDAPPIPARATQLTLGFAVRRGEIALGDRSQSLEGVPAVDRDAIERLQLEALRCVSQQLRATHARLAESRAPTPPRARPCAPARRRRSRPSRRP